MNQRKGNRSKEVYGSKVKRSEYDDGILRNNQHTVNRLKIDMHYYDRAQKVVMKNLGRESNFLQTKLESERKQISLGLSGSKIGLTSVSTARKHTATSPFESNKSFKAVMRTSRADTKLPWCKETIDKASILDTTSPESKACSKYKPSTFSASATSRDQTDNFLSTILNQALNDEASYAQGPELWSQNQVTQSKTTQKRTKNLTRTLQNPSNSLKDTLSDVNVPFDADEVIF